MTEHTALVLEGGAMRGIYTAGALDVFLEQGLQFPYVIGVSAGALNALSYISGQRGRNAKVTLEMCIRDRFYKAPHRRVFPNKNQQAPVQPTDNFIIKCMLRKNHFRKTVDGI